MTRYVHPSEYMQMWRDGELGNVCEPQVGKCFACWTKEQYEAFVSPDFYEKLWGEIKEAESNG